jgi:hypothetical protein
LCLAYSNAENDREESGTPTTRRDNWRIGLHRFWRFGGPARRLSAGQSLLEAVKTSLTKASSVGVPLEEEKTPFSNRNTNERRERASLFESMGCKFPIATKLHCSQS